MAGLPIMTDKGVEGVIYSCVSICIVSEHCIRYSHNTSRYPRAASARTRKLFPLPRWCLMVYCFRVVAKVHLLNREGCTR